MNTKTKVTLIESNAEVRNLIQGFLVSKGYEVEVSPSNEMALQTYANPNAKTDLIIADAVGAAQFIVQMKRLQPSIAVVLTSAVETQEQANEGIAQGAFFLLSKPLKLTELGMVVEIALKQSRLQREVIQLRDRISVDEQNSRQSIFADFPNLGELEKRYMKIVLEKTKGRKEKAARILGINRRTLYRKEREYGWVTDDAAALADATPDPKSNLDLGLQSGMDH